MSKVFDVYGAKWCPDCHVLRQWLMHHGVHFRWHDIESSEKIAQKFQKLTSGKVHIPVVTVGEELIKGSVDEIISHIRKETDSKPLQSYDVVVIGAGPAGLTTAMYLAREKMKVMVLDAGASGGQAATTAYIENYPGVKGSIHGLDLMTAMREQAEDFGVHIREGEPVKMLTPAGSYVEVSTENADYRARTAVLAIGTRYRHLQVEGAEEAIGMGVHYCATCDGPLYRGRRVVVVGAGNSALQEALFLSQYVEHIDLIGYEDHLTATALLQERIKTVGKKVTFHLGFEVVKLSKNEDRLSGVTIKNRMTGDNLEIAADGVFVFIGLEPQTKWLEGIVDLDPQGFIIADAQMHTSLPFVYVAGDCRKGSTKQVAAAVGEGAAVAMSVKHHLEGV